MKYYSANCENVDKNNVNEGDYLIGKGLAQQGYLGEQMYKPCRHKANYFIHWKTRWTWTRWLIASGSDASLLFV